MHHVCMLAMCSGMTNVLTNEGLFNIDLNPMYRPMAADALSDATLKQIESDIEADNAEKKPDYPHLVYCPRLSNSADTLPVGLRPTGDLGILYDKASANTPLQHHIDVTEMFSLVVNSGTADDYNEAATRYRQMFGETAKSNNAGFFVFHGGFQSHSGWQKRYQGPAFNFLDAFETGRVVPAMKDDWVRDWLIFWLRFNRVVMTEAEAEEALTHVSVSHSASICWSLLLQGRQETVVPNMVPNALEAEPLPADTPQATVWQDKCVYKCGPKAKTDGTCTSDVNCKAKCLAEPKCKGYYLTQGCAGQDTCGALVNSAPRDNELANAQDSGFGTYNLFYAKELYESNGGAGIAFHELGTFPVGKRVVQTHVYKKTACGGTTPVVEGTPHETLTQCENARADRCVKKKSGTGWHGVAHNETVTDCSTVHERISRNVPSACRATCLDTDTCLSWTWDAGACTHYTGVGELTTSSVVPDLGMLQELGMNVSYACNKTDQVYDMCVQKCVHIRNKLHHGWCNNKWVNCKAGKFAEAQTDIPAQDKGKSVCTGGFHPEDDTLLGSNIVQYRTGRASPLTYRAYAGFKFPLNYGDESDRAPVSFGGREGAYTASRCGDIGAYIMDTGSSAGNVTFEAWQEFSRGELHTNVEGRMSKLVEDIMPHQHSWPTHTFVSMGLGSKSSMDGNAYASPLAGTSAKPADGIGPITFPKCQISGSAHGRLYSFTRGQQCVEDLNANMEAYYDKSLAWVDDTTNTVFKAGVTGSPYYGTHIWKGPAATEPNVATNAATGQSSGLYTRATSSDAAKYLICFQPAAGGTSVLIDSPSSEKCKYHKSEHALVSNVAFERAYGDNQRCYMTMADMKEYYDPESTLIKAKLRQFPRGVGCKADTVKTPVLSGFQPFYTRVLKDKYFDIFPNSLYYRNDNYWVNGALLGHQCQRDTPERAAAVRFFARACVEGPRQFFSRYNIAGLLSHPTTMPVCCKLFEIDLTCKVNFYQVRQACSTSPCDMGVPVGNLLYRYFGSDSYFHPSLEGWPHADNVIYKDSYTLGTSWYREFWGFALAEPALGLCPGMTIHTEWTDAEYAFAAVHPRHDPTFGDCGGLSADCPPISGVPTTAKPGADVYMVHNPNPNPNHADLNTHVYVPDPSMDLGDDMYDFNTYSYGQPVRPTPAVKFSETDPRTYQQQCWDACSVYTPKYCIFTGGRFHGEEATMGEPKCYTSQTCDMVVSAKATVGSFLQATVGAEALAEEATLQDLVDDGAIMPKSLEHMHPPVDGSNAYVEAYVQNAQRAFADGGTKEQSTTYYPPPAERYKMPYKLNCELDFNIVPEKYPLKVAPDGFNSNDYAIMYTVSGYRYMGKGTCGSSTSAWTPFCGSAAEYTDETCGVRCTSKSRCTGYTVGSDANNQVWCFLHYDLSAGAKGTEDAVFTVCYGHTDGRASTISAVADYNGYGDQRCFKRYTPGHSGTNAATCYNAVKEYCNTNAIGNDCTFSLLTSTACYLVKAGMNGFNVARGTEYMPNHCTATSPYLYNMGSGCCESNVGASGQALQYDSISCSDVRASSSAGENSRYGIPPGDLYQFKCKVDGIQDHLPHAWKVSGAREVYRNPNPTTDGKVWKMYVATVRKGANIRYTSQHLATPTGADNLHDTNAVNAGFMCPVGVIIGGSTDTPLTAVKSNPAIRDDWHPLAQTTLMCPHDKPVRCSKLVVVEVAGGTCEYSSETGKQQHHWSGATAQTIEPGNENMENWKSKLGQNAPCHRYDFACHSIADDEETEVCGHDSRVETALGGARCGTGSTGGFCGVNATDGTTVDTAAAHCDQWPTGDRKVCPDGFAYFHKTGASRATCVPARAAHKNHGVLREHLAPTLVMETGDKDGQYYTMSSCKEDTQVATADGRCIDKDCAARSEDVCESQDVIPGVKSCAWSGGACTAYPVVGVRAQGGATVVPRSSFVPEVLFSGQWYPICGHYFWDNNNGATQVCNELGWPTGIVIQQHAAYPWNQQSKYVGRCPDVRSLDTCESANWPSVNGVNHPDNYCAGGQAVAIHIVCNENSEHWWPGFVQKKGAFSGVGPAYVRQFETCDGPHSVTCKGFDKCGEYTSPVADCASEANVKTKCCARAGVSIDVAKAGVCEASPSTKCAGGKFMYNTEDSLEDAANITYNVPTPAPTGSECPTTHPWVADRHSGASSTTVAGGYCCRAKPTPAGTPLGSIRECLENAHMDCPGGTCTGVTLAGGTQMCSCDQDKCEAGTEVESATVELKLNVSLDAGYTADLKELFLVLVDTTTGASVRAEGCTGPQSRLEGGALGKCACRPAETAKTVVVSSGPVYEKSGGTAADCLRDVDCIGTANDKMLYTHATAERDYNSNGHAPYQSYPSRNRPYRCNYYETCAPDRPFPGEIAFTLHSEHDLKVPLADCQSFTAVHRAQHWCVGLGDSCAYLAKGANDKYCALPDSGGFIGGNTYTVYQKHTAHDLYGYTHGMSAVNLKRNDTLTMFDANAAAVCSADEECAAYSVVGDKLYIYKTGGSSAPDSVYLKGKKLLAGAPCPPLQPCAHGTNVRQGDKCVCRCDDFFAGPLCDRCSSANRDETCRACKDNFMPGQNDVCICQPGFDISTGCTTCKSGFEGVFCQTNTCAVTMQETVGPLSYTLKNVAIAYDAAGQLYDGVIGAGDGRVPYSMQNTFVKVHGITWFLYASPTAARVKVKNAADLPTDTVHNIAGGEWLYSIPEKAGPKTVADIVDDENTWGYVCTLGTGGNAPTDKDKAACATSCDTTTCGSWHWNDGTCTTYQRGSESEFTASEHNIDTRNCRSGGVRLAGKYRNLPAMPSLAVPNATRMLQKVPDNMLWTVVCAHGYGTAKFILSEYRRHPWTGGPCAQRVQLTWLYSLPRGQAMDVTTPHYHGLARTTAVQTTVNAPSETACAAECKAAVCEAWIYYGTDCMLSSGAAVATMSSEHSDFPASNCVDGDVTTFCHSRIAGGEWLQLDLGSSQPISMVKIWNRVQCCQDRLGTYYVEYTNNANGVWSECGHYTASDTVGPFDAACVATARYVRIRLQQASEYLNLAEVQVFRPYTVWGGALKPTNTFPVPAKMVASMSSQHPNYPSANCIDGNTGNMCHSADTTAGGEWLQLDLGSNHRIYAVKIWNRDDGSMDRLGLHELQLSNDMGAWSTCGTYTATATVGPFQEQCFGKARYVRIHQLTDPMYLNLAEVQVLRSPVVPAYLLPDKSAALPDVATRISTVSNYRECCYACASSVSWQMAGARCSCFDGGEMNGAVSECYVPTMPAAGQACNVAITMMNKGAFKPDRAKGTCFNLLAVTNYAKPEDCSALCLDEEECDVAHHTSAAVCTLLQCARPDLAKGDVDTGTALYIKSGGCVQQPNGMCHYRPRRAGHASGACSANGASVAYQADVRLYYNDDNEGNSVPVLGGQGCSGTPGVDRMVAEMGKLEPALPSPPGVLLQTADTNLLMHRFDPGVYPSTTGFEYTDSPETGPTQAVAAITRDMRLPTLNVAGRRRRTVPNALGVAPNQAATFQITQSIAVPLENAACHEQARLATVMAGLKSPSMEQGRCSGTNAKDLVACTRVKHYTSALETIQAAYVQQLASCHAEAVGMDYASPLQLMMYVQPRAGLERVEYQGLPTYYAPRNVHGTAGLPRLGAMALGSHLAPAVAGTAVPTPPVFETPSPTPSPHVDKPNIKCTAQEHCCFAEQPEHKTSPAWHAEEKVLEILVDTQHVADTGPECMALCARFLLCRVAEWTDGVCHMWSLPIKLAHLQHNETFWVTPPETNCVPSASIMTEGVRSSRDATVYVKQDCCLRHMLH